MAFSLLVEMLNIRIRKKRAARPVVLHGPDSSVLQKETRM